jgi:hypothetical protein
MRCGNWNATFGLSAVSIGMSKDIRGVEMQGVEVVERYRSYAAQCLAISRNVSDLTGKLVLLEMAQSWLKLAEQAGEDADPALDQDTGVSTGRQID